MRRYRSFSLLANDPAFADEPRDPSAADLAEAREGAESDATEEEVWELALAIMEDREEWQRRDVEAHEAEGMLDDRNDYGRDWL